MKEVNIPTGFRQDAKGNLVLEAKISEFKLTRDEFVQELFGKAEEMSKALSAFKGVVIDDLDDFFELSAENHDEMVRGAKGCYSLFSVDIKSKLQYRTWPVLMRYQNRSTISARSGRRVARRAIRNRGCS